VQGANVLFLSQVETHETIRAFFAPGTLSPLHSSGIGKALLSQMEPARRDRLLGEGPLERFTPHTLTDRQTLAMDLARAKALGYAEDREEKNLGMRCIAAPVFDIHNEAVAGLSVSGPTSRMAEDAVPAIGKAVAAAARDLTLALGGSVPA
jgi:IclR family acetate operon transcriptional repressor